MFIELFAKRVQNMLKVNRTSVGFDYLNPLPKDKINSL